MSPAHDATTRFSDRVEDYVRFRPRYPEAVVTFLESRGALETGAAVADIGSGTGIFADLLLRRGYTVWGVEPNDRMRAAAEKLLAGHSRFRSVSGTAEATSLPDHSVRLVTAAQAFHWFDRERSATEFRRILAPRGHVALVWNARRTGSSPFLVDYESLLREHAIEYYELRHAALKESGAIESFFSGRDVETFRCPNSQEFDYEGLKGRLLSSSYAPKPGHPRHEPMIQALHGLFARYQSNGVVRFDYDTEVTLGSLA